MLGFFTNKNTIQEDALSGDPKRYERVYISLYQNRDVKNNIERLLREGNSHGIDADEVIQECMISLDNALLKGNFNGKSTIMTYFKIICANYISDKVFRKKKIYDYKGDDTDLVEMSKGLSQSGEEVLMRSEENKALDEVRAKLTPDCQEYLDLKYLQTITEYSQKKIKYKDIAAERNIAEQSVKNAISRCEKTYRGLVLGHLHFKDRFKNIKFE